jgi:hypothetical protein
MSKSFVGAKVGGFSTPSMQSHFIVAVIAIPKPERRYKDGENKGLKRENSFHRIEP